MILELKFANVISFVKYSSFKIGILHKSLVTLRSSITETFVSHTSKSTASSAAT